MTYLRAITALIGIANKYGCKGTIFLRIGQTNRVLLHIVTNYEPRPLAKSIKRYFEKNTEAKEVLVLKGKKIITVNREDTLGESYIKNFLKKYKK